MKFSINDLFSKCDQICRKLRIWSHLLKKSLMDNFIFCAVNFKVALSDLSQFLATESLLKMMKNAFISPYKLFLFSKFSLDIWVMYKNDLIRNVRIISKFMTPQPGKQITAIHILSNISGSKGKQIIKFDQLIEYSMKNIFLEKSFTKCGVEIIPRRFI